MKLEKIDSDYKLGDFLRGGFKNFDGGVLQVPILLTVQDKDILKH